MTSTIDHEHHHLRRTALNPLFSKPALQSSIIPYVQTCADKIRDRFIAEYRGTNKVLSLNDVWASFAADIALYFAFATEHNYLDKPDFDSPFIRAVRAPPGTAHLANHFGWLVPLMAVLPVWLVRIVQPEQMPVVGLKRVSSSS